MPWTQADVDAINARRGATLPAHLPPAKKRSKMGNVKTDAHGITFDSGREAKRYSELLFLEKAGEISDLERQVTYDICVNGVFICRYRCDYEYLERGKKITEDAKGHKTPEYVIKRKLMKAVHGITIRET